MSKAAVKISTDLLSNPLCEQDQAFLESMNALDTAMKRMDSFNQEKVRLVATEFKKWLFSVCWYSAPHTYNSFHLFFHLLFLELHLYHPSLSAQASGY